MKRTFSQRMWRAVAFIESSAEHFRQLDEAFESGDGDQMWAALWTLAKTRASLAVALPKYVSTPENMPRCSGLVGLPMREIRSLARRSREEFYAAFNMDGCPKY